MHFWNQEYGVMNPYSNFIVTWDIIMLILILCISFSVPYEAGFFESTETKDFFYLNRVTDAAFAIDLVLNFFVPIKDAHTSNWIFDRATIMRKYLRGYFWIDALSLVPFDVIAGNIEGTNSVRILRLIKILRFAKVIKVFTALKIVRKWESKLSLNYRALFLVNLIFLALIVSHWVVCTWSLLLSIDNTQWYECFEWLEIDSSPSQNYISALYWGIGMIFRNGPRIIIQSDIQRMIFIMVVIWAGLFQALVIGGVVATMNQLLEGRRTFNRKMDIVNHFLKERDLINAKSVKMPNGSEITGPEFCERLRSYYIYGERFARQTSEWREIIESCSPFLCNAVATRMHSRALRRIWSFRHASDHLIAFLVMHMDTSVYVGLCVCDFFTLLRFSESDSQTQPQI